MSGVGMGSDMFGGFGAADEDDEEALIQRALEMSMRDVHIPVAAPSAAAPSSSMELDEDDDVSALRVE